LYTCLSAFWEFENSPSVKFCFRLLQTSSDQQQTLISKIKTEKAKATYEYNKNNQIKTNKEV
jgi:hypothetical protein